MRAPEPQPENVPDHRETEEAPSAASQLFDLRTIIAILFIFYGVVLTIMGLFFETSDDIAKAGGINLNLWSGIVMIIVAAGFFFWARTRPLAPPPSAADDDRPPMHH
jgi:quinol-cytochrome oxidoreductase complex cytochrome b subunit